MNYTIQDQDGTLIIDLTGDTWGTLQEMQLKAEVSAAVAMGRSRFLVDLSRVGFITSMGLGVLVASWATIRNTGGRLVLCGPGPRVQTVMSVAGVDQVMEIRRSRQEGLAALD